MTLDSAAVGGVCCLSYRVDLPERRQKMAQTDEMTFEQREAFGDLQRAYGAVSWTVSKHAECHPGVTLIDRDGDHWTISPNGDYSMLWTHEQIAAGDHRR